MNDLCGKVYEALKSELSEITSKTIIELSCKKAGKNPDTVTVEDIEKIKSEILSAVFLFGKAEKAGKIKEKLEQLKQH